LRETVLTRRLKLSHKHLQRRVNMSETKIYHV